MGAVHQLEDALAHVLIQLTLMIAAARLMNTLFRRAGQPGAVGEIVAGLLLGPSLFGALFPETSAAVFGTRPDPAISILSQLGLVLLMFQIGSDFAFDRLAERRARRATLAIAAVSVAVPLAAGIALGFASHAALAPAIDRGAYALFVGVALAITAVPILGRILRQFDLNRTEVGTVAISAAALNDVVGWVLLAAISAFATARLSGSGIALQLAALAGFAVALWAGGRPLARWLTGWGGDDPLPPNLMAAVFALIFLCGLATKLIGIFTIFGGFAAGLLFHRHHAFVAAWRERVGGFVVVFFLPVFFTFTGLRTNVLGLTTMEDWAWLAAVLALAVGGKMIPVYFAARVSGFAPAEARTLGALMNTRALMELIVLNIGFELGFIPQAVFTMLVIMAVVTTLMTGPLLRRWLPRAGHAIPRGVEA